MYVFCYNDKNDDLVYVATKVKEFFRKRSWNLNVLQKYLEKEDLIKIANSNVDIFISDTIVRRDIFNNEIKELFNKNKKLFIQTHNIPLTCLVDSEAKEFLNVILKQQAQYVDRSIRLIQDENDKTVITLNNIEVSDDDAKEKQFDTLKLARNRKITNV